MSDFATVLLSATGAATDSHDIRAMVRRCFYYDFLGYPVRIWDGEGVLTTTDGNEWLGSIDGNGTNHHRAAAVRDARDGASPRYEFSMPFIDQATYDAIKADQDLATGREMTCYNAIFVSGEGIAPQTPIRFNYRLQIMGVKFGQRAEATGGTTSLTYSASVLCRSLEYGRSRVPAGTYTDTAQRERARIEGYADDTFCSFVAANSNRTYVIGGN